MLINYSILQKCGDPAENHGCWDCLREHCYDFYVSQDCPGLAKCGADADCK